MSSVDVAVVGAGPYGLSLASRLAAQRTSFRIFGRPMETWISAMPDAMYLKSEGFASNLDEPEGRLTLEQFCRESGTPYAHLGAPVPRETFVRYGLWFKEHAVPQVEETEVLEVRQDDGGYAVRLPNDTVDARRVVVATGFGGFAYVPTQLQHLLGGGVTHTAAHSSFAPFAGTDVAVVGAGQSALETAALLREAGARPQVIVRAPALTWNGRCHGRPLWERIRWPLSPLGTGLRLWAYANWAPAYRFLPAETRVRVARETLGPAGAWWLRERVEPDLPIHLAQRLVAADREGQQIRVTLNGAGSERQLRVDHVIAGTGYRMDLDRMSFLAPELRQRLARVGGAPALSAHFESSLPGLYFVGFPAAHTFGPVMRFVCGTAVSSPRIAAHVRASRRG
jgi:cation diffusion facilitator CzcD-associated flavoprotein CzcO